MLYYYQKNRLNTRKMFEILQLVNPELAENIDIQKPI